MKKIFILGGLLLTSPIWAQTYIQNARTVNDLSSSAIPIAPGISVVPPTWMRSYNNNISNSNTSNSNSNSNRNFSNNTPGSIPVMDENTGTVTIPSSASAQAQAERVKNSVNAANASNNKTNNPEELNKKPVVNMAGSVSNAPVLFNKPVAKPAVAAMDISQWNRTTQKEIEEKAQGDLQARYKEFLMKR